MESYRWHTVKPPADENDFECIVAIQPAAPGTRIVQDCGQSQPTYVPCLFWGVSPNLSLVPITANGVWDGAGNKQFVLHPGGHCDTNEYELGFESEELALEWFKKRD